MPVAAIKELTKEVKGSNQEQKQFRAAANQNNRSIETVAKDISKVFQVQKRDNVRLNNSIQELNDTSAENSAKLDSSNRLLRESISLQNIMVGELRNSTALLKNIFSGIQGLGILNASGSGVDGITNLLGGKKKAMATGLGMLGLAGGAAALYFGGGGGGSDNQDSAASTSSGARSTRGAGETGSSSEAMQFFQSKGWTKEQAAGIVGNLQAESGSNLRTNAVGDGGKAYGIAQWHPPRQRLFKQQMGVDIRDSTFKQQLEFIQWELGNSEKNAGERLKAATTAAAAAIIVDKYYERSKGLHTERRIANANTLVGNNQQQSRGQQSPQGQSSSGPSQQPQAAATPFAPSGPPVTIRQKPANQIGAGHGQSSPTLEAGRREGTPNDATRTAADGATPGRNGLNNNKLRNVNPGIVEKLKQIESSFGGTLQIKSGFRGEAHNRSVGGARNSAHTRGNAVDVTFEGGIPATLKLIEAASKAGIGGIGVYRPGSVHLDIESRRAWGQNFRRNSVPKWAEEAIKAHETGKWGEYDSQARSGNNVGDMGGEQSGRQSGAQPGSQSQQMADPMGQMGNASGNNGGGQTGGMMGEPGGMGGALGGMSGLLGGIGGMFGGPMGAAVGNIVGSLMSNLGAGTNTEQKEPAPTNNRDNIYGSINQAALEMDGNNNQPRDAQQPVPEQPAQGSMVGNQMASFDNRMGDIPYNTWVRELTIAMGGKSQPTMFNMSA
jgi:hypothetical protein